MKSSFFDFKVFLPVDATYDSIGAHQRQLTIVSDHLAEATADLEFLRKILAAAKFDLDQDTALISLGTNSSLQFATYQKQKQPKFCLSFGISPQRLGLNFNSQYYQPFTYADCTFLFAHSLSELPENVNYRGALWKCLQALFLS